VDASGKEEMPAAKVRRPLVLAINAGHDGLDGLVASPAFRMWAAG